MAPKARPQRRPQKPMKAKRPIWRPPAVARTDAAKGVKKDYDPAMMREARDCVVQGELTTNAHEVREYEEFGGVSTSTLWRHAKGKSSP